MAGLRALGALLGLSSAPSSLSAWEYSKTREDDNEGYDQSRMERGTNLGLLLWPTLLLWCVVLVCVGY